VAARPVRVLEWPTVPALPIVRVQRGTVASASGVALLTALDPEDVRTRPLANMNHLLRDHLLHELDILARDPNVSIVLGVADHWRSRPLNVVHELRRRVFATARVQFRSPPADNHGCFERLYTYPWSCDRDLQRWLGRRGRVSLRTLRRLLPPRAPISGSPLNEGSSTLLYARTDTSRRRLLNASAHMQALREQLGGFGTRLVLWDDVWRTQPSVLAQSAIIRDASQLITPHAAVCTREVWWAPPHGPAPRRPPRSAEVRSPRPSPLFSGVGKV